MDVQIAVSKIRKYATSDSGDTVEVVERPQGGVSVVLADGQTSGRGAKWISALVVRKVIALLAEGVRDGAAARAASDSLFTEKNGKVSSTLNIVSVDHQTQTLVISRNNPTPAILAYGDQVRLLDEASQPVGVRRDTRPVITEVPVEPGITVVVYSDGLTYAGDRNGNRMDVLTCVKALLENDPPSPQSLADSLLAHAYHLDNGRPADDISVVAVRVGEHRGDDVRRMMVRIPFNS
jgi:serine phosphatase RsbU (regulator of sigma subunit)